MVPPQYFREGISRGKNWWFDADGDLRVPALRMLGAMYETRWGEECCGGVWCEEAKDDGVGRLGRTGAAPVHGARCVIKSFDVCVRKKNAGRMLALPMTDKFVFVFTSGGAEPRPYKADG
jgi:hypothetical protein